MKSKQSVKLKLKVKPKVKVFLPQIRKRLVRQLLKVRKYKIQWLRYHIVWVWQ